MSRDVSEADLLLAAQKLGCSYDSRDLKRFRQEQGVLQRSAQAHETGVRGSVSYYPPEALGQIKAICLGRKQHYYRYDELRFHLWWDGHWVDPAMLRETQERLLSEQLAVLSDWKEQYGSIDNVADAAAKEVSNLQGRNPLLRILRWQIGHERADLETFAYNIVLLAYGKDPVWESVDVGADEIESTGAEVMHRAMYSTRGRGPKNTTTGQSFADLSSPEELPKTIGMMRSLGILPLGNLKGILATATSTQLELARDDARVFTEDLRIVSEAAEVLFGRGAFGLGMFRAFRVPPTALGLRVSMVPMMVAFRSGPPELSENLDVVKTAVRSIVPRAKKVKEIQKRLKDPLGRRR